MLHKITAAILSCLMLVVATTSQLGLNYCLCEKIIFLGDCACATPTSQQTKSPPNQASSSSCHCCPSTPEEPSSTSLTISPLPYAPCGPCIVPLDWQLDDCPPQAAPDFKTNADSYLANTTPPATSITSPTTGTHPNIMEIRGSPPHATTNNTPPTVPLYIRHSVFLI